MAIIKWSGLVTSVSGKLSGSVLQGGSFGQVLRSNHYGRKPQSVPAYESRSVFASISNYGANLSDTDKAAKAAAGALITRPTKGGSATPYNWWAFNQTFNGKLAVIGVAPVAGGWVAPIISAIAGIDISHAGGTINFTIDTATTVSASENVIIMASGPVKSTTSFKLSRMRVVDIGGPSVSFWNVPASKVELVFGTTSFSVARWFTVQVVNTATGFFSPVVPHLYVP